MRDLPLLRSFTGLELWRPLFFFSHRLCILPNHLLFDPGHEFLADFHAVAFQRLNNLYGRGVHPESGQRARDRSPLAGRHFSPRACHGPAQFPCHTAQSRLSHSPRSRQFSAHLAGLLSLSIILPVALVCDKAELTVKNEELRMASLFQEFRLKDVSLRNRIAVSPMCQYSSDNGFLNDWHLVHLGSRAVGGAGLVIVEATAVSPEGRISPADSGIYLDEHVEPLARISRFLKEHGAVAGIQIAHAGRKASANTPWEGNDHIETENGGWDTIAPSAIPFGDNLPKAPREMTVGDITAVQKAFVAAAKRALEAGFEWLELHFAHGYLAHEFYSPLANKRTDQYGGSFDNRIRFLLETFEAVRKVWPERFPLTARLSVTDWTEGGVTLEESIELVRRLKAGGLDLLDVSHGLITPDVSNIPWGPGFLVPAAGRIRRESEIPTAVGWMISTPEQAEQAVQNEDADLVMLAREMLRDPYWSYRAAVELGADVASNILPVQYARAVD